MKVYIIHQKAKNHRDRFIQDIIKQYDEVEIIEPIKVHNSIQYGGRRTNEVYRRNELSLTLTNILLLKRIVSEKMDNVLILEDDAIMINEIPNIDYKPYNYYYLHSSRINATDSNIYDCHAMLYPTWQKTNELLDIILSMEKYLAWDNLLNHIRKKYHLYADQSNIMVFKQASGKSSIITSYYNNRYN